MQHNELASYEPPKVFRAKRDLWQVSHGTVTTNAVSMDTTSADKSYVWIYAADSGVVNLCKCRRSIAMLRKRRTEKVLKAQFFERLQICDAIFVCNLESSQN